MTFLIKKATCICICMLMMPVLCAPLLAQQDKGIRLPAFIDSAQVHFPLLLQKAELVNSAVAQVTDIKHSFLPNAIIADQLILASDNSIPGSYLSMGVIPSTSAGVRKENNYQTATGNIAVLNSQYELLDFGLKKAKVRYAESYKDLSAADLEKERYLLKWQIAKLYLGVLKNQYQLDIDRQNMNRYEEIYKVIQALTLSGIKAGVDSSLALAELAKTRISYNQTLGQNNQLKLQLAYLTGIPAQQVVIDSSGTSALLSSLKWLSTQMDSASNPLIDYYARQQSLYGTTANIIKKSYLPKVLLNASAWSRGSSLDYAGAYKPLQTGLGYQRFNYIAGLTVAYDLFNGIHKKDKLAINDHNFKAANYQLLQQQRLLENMQQQAEEAIRTDLSNLSEMPVQIKAAQDAYAQKKAQYRAGIINLVDLTNASFVLYRSQSDYVQTLSNWILANLDKAAATGNLDLFIQTVK